MNAITYKGWPKGMDNRRVMRIHLIHGIHTSDRDNVTAKLDTVIG